MEDGWTDGLIDKTIGACSLRVNITTISTESVAFSINLTYLLSKIVK